jgi:hypothetical protein
MGIVILTTIVWVLKSATYWMVFRYRTIRATVMDCLVIAGAPLLISAVPLPLPSFIFILVSIGLASYLTMHYTSVGFIPDGLFIPLGVEIVFRVAVWAAQESGLL